MSKLQELINELCPNGVIFKKIVEVCEVKRGRVISKKTLNENKGNFPVYSSQTQNNGELGRINTYDFDGEFVTWTTDGAHAGTVFYREGKFSVTNICGILKVKDNKVLMVKYLNYILSINTKKHVKAGSGNPKLMSNVVANIKIPIPPIEVQNEIVKILDSFTNLTAELTAELTARKKQKSYYYRELFNFSDDVSSEKLGALANFQNGKGHEKNILEDGKFVVVNSKFVSTDGLVKKFTDRQLIPLFKKDIVLVMSDLPNGKALAKTFFVEENEKYSLNQRIGRITVKSEEKILPKYLFYYLNRNKQLLRYDNGADQTNLRKQDILNINIPVPVVTEQMRIINILDNFSKLTKDLNEGLPAEIEARQKQYEYYRKKLLTFKEL